MTILKPLLLVMLVFLFASTSATTISGTLKVCTGSTTALTIDTVGGTWSSSNPAVASVNATTGVVTGITAGGTVIRYNLPGATYARSLYSYLQPSAITGSGVLCEGATMMFANAMGSAGTWTSADPSIATVISNGRVTGVSGGVVPITYQVTISGCFVTREATVNALPAPIAVPPGVCPGVPAALVSSPGGGVWASSNTSVATIDAASGVVTGISGGLSSYYLAVITYTLPTSCRRVTQITVNSSPGAIIGATTMCTGSTGTLICGTPGGTWSSSAPGVASISSTGVVSAINNGTTVINYTKPSGCAATVVVTVSTGLAANTGTSAICVGQTTMLENGTTGGTWTSDAPSVANVNATSGLVSGVNAGTANITYTVGAGCSSVTQVTVNSVSLPIVGTTTICEGGTTHLTYGTPGGTWSSSIPANATVDATSGDVTGIAAGTSIVTYTLGSGCFRVTTITVQAPPAAITGPDQVCVGNSIVVTSSPSGGAWTTDGVIASVTPSVGNVTGLTAGVTAITYTTGASCSATYQITVNALPAAISGTASTCVGGTTALSSDGVGVWSSSLITKATVNAGTGVVTGIAAGTSVITYMPASGCFRTIVVTVTAAPAAISGTLSLCPVNSTTLSAGTSGKTWVSSDPSVASINATTGVVTALSAGNTTISYTVGSCSSAPVVMTVNAAPPPNDGVPIVCIGPNSILLTNTVSGGVWSASNSKVVLNPSSCLGRGVSTGTVNITYTTGIGCYAVTNVTVNPAMTAILGPTSVCPGSEVSLSHAIGGGTWTSTNTANATIDASGGQLAGLSSGTTTISYVVSGACFTSRTETIVSPPSAIAGDDQICAGAINTFSISGGGGTWSTSNEAVASVSVSTGAVTGVATGTAILTYRVTSTGCNAVRQLTVNPAPHPITGPISVCVGGATTVENETTGGSWSVNYPVRASINSETGEIVGLSAGTVTVTYTLEGGCFSTHDITVNNGAGEISGPSSLCVDGNITLISSVEGGTWSSSNTGVATVDPASGIVTGVASGSVTITYYGTADCYVTKPVTVGHVDATTTGGTIVCVGATVTIGVAMGGGTWSSTNPSVATVSAAGVVGGLAPGTSTISYSVSNSCGTAVATSLVEVEEPISPGTVTGPDTVCKGWTGLFETTGSGGIWSSSNNDIVIVSATGLVEGIDYGSEMIYYVVTNSCGTFSSSHPVTIKDGISPNGGTLSGLPTVCQAATIEKQHVVVHLLVNDPVSIAGEKIHSETFNWGGQPLELTDVQAIMGPEGDTTGCDPFESGYFSGKIAILWRGDCEFGQKALNAQNAGAVAVVIINNITGYPTYMSAGSVGNLVAIPVYMIGKEDGIAIAARLHAAEDVRMNLNLEYVSDGPWSTTDPSIAVINSSGILTGVSAGVTGFTYSVVNSCGYINIFNTVEVLPLPDATISGGTAVCLGSMLALTSPTIGGTWVSDNTEIATVDEDGHVFGVGIGTVEITHMVETTCGTDTSTEIINVEAPLSAGELTGGDTVCKNLSVYFSSTEGGGHFTTSNLAAISVTSIGQATGHINGTEMVYYIVSNSCGSDTASHALTVRDGIAVNGNRIIGSDSVCFGATIALQHVATTLSISGPEDISGELVFTGADGWGGVHASLVNQPLKMGPVDDTIGCTSFAPGYFDGKVAVIWRGSCEFALKALNAQEAGAVAVVIVNNIPGDYPIYMGGGAISSLVTIPVYMIGNADGGAIASKLHIGTPVQLNVTLDTSSSGLWGTSNIVIADVNPAGIVTGIWDGSCNIQLTTENSCGTFTTQHALRVILSGGPDNEITGPSELCELNTATYSTLAEGGTWSSSNEAVATIDPVTGVAGGVSAGSMHITYTAASTGCYTVKDVIVKPSPDVSLPSSYNICSGTSAHLKATVNGSELFTVSSGTINVPIPDNNSTGAFTSQSISGLPVDAIVNSISVTLNMTHTYMGDMVINLTAPNGNTLNLFNRHGAGGDNLVNTVVSSTSSLTYSSGAPPYTGTYGATGALGVGALAFSANVTNFSELLSVLNGEWVLSGRDQAGADTGAFTSWTITIDYSIPAVVTWSPVTGLYQDTGLGIVYESGLNESSVFAYFDTTSSSPVTQIYTATIAQSGCTIEVPTNVTYLPSSPSTGPTAICEGAFTTIGNGTPGGIWSTSDFSIASIGPGGELEAIRGGAVLISYSVSDGACYVTKEFVVHSIPNAPVITPSAGIICPEGPAHLGVFGTSGPTVVSTGPISISIPDNTPAGIHTDLSVSGIPFGAEITEVSVMLNVTHPFIGDLIINLTAPNGNTLNLFNKHGSSGDNLVNTIVSSAGSTVFSTGGAPFTGTFAATGSMNIGATGFLSNVNAFDALYSEVNGTWKISIRDATNHDVGVLTSAQLVISYNVPYSVTWSDVDGLYTDAALTAPLSPDASIDSVYADFHGATPIVRTYTVTSTIFECSSSSVVNVTSFPVLPEIEGPTSVCAGSNVALSDGIYVGSWTSSNAEVATVNSSGVVTGLSGGSVVITHFASPACFVTHSMTVNPLSSGILSGPSTINVGNMVTLSGAGTGGSWISGNATIATVDASGIVTGVGFGTTEISYTVAPGDGVCPGTSTHEISVLPPAGLDFDGTDDYLSFTEDISGVINFTFETWIYVKEHQSWNRVFDFGNGPTQCIFFSSSHGISGRPRFAINIGFGEQIVESPDAIPTNTWTHLAITLDGTTASIYINGELVVANSDFSYTPSNLGATVNNYIGRSQFTADAYLNATMDEVRIWNVTRSVEQINANMYTSLAGTESGLIRYYKFDQGVPRGVNTTDTTAIDITGHAAGTLNNFELTGCTSNFVCGMPSFGACVTDVEISGPETVEVGSSVSLSGTGTGGTWSSSNTSIATVDPGTGVVTGIDTGTAIIYYNNSCGTAASHSMEVTGGIVMPCTPVYTDPDNACSAFDCYIYDFSLSGAFGTSITDIGTGCDGTGYQNRIGIVAPPTLETGSSYTGTLRTGTYEEAFVQAWIDFNNDGVLDIVESIGGNTIPALGSFSFSVTIPVSATTGVHVMRVRLGWVGVSSPYPDLLPCDDLLFGEAHDYTVNIGAAARPGGQVTDPVSDIASFSVAPNPTTGNLTINTSVAGELAVYTIDGREMKRYAVADGSSVVAMPSGIASGVYMLRFKGNDGSTKMMRIVYQP